MRDAARGGPFNECFLWSAGSFRSAWKTPSSSARAATRNRVSAISSRLCSGTRGGKPPRLLTIVPRLTMGLTNSIAALLPESRDAATRRLDSGGVGSPSAGLFQSSLAVSGLTNLGRLLKRSRNLRTPRANFRFATIAPKRGAGSTLAHVCGNRLMVLVHRTPISGGLIDVRRPLTSSTSNSHVHWQATATRNGLRASRHLVDASWCAKIGYLGLLAWL